MSRPRLSASFAKLEQMQDEKREALKKQLFDAIESGLAEAMEKKSRTFVRIAVGPEGPDADAVVRFAKPNREVLALAEEIATEEGLKFKEYRFLQPSTGMTYDYLDFSRDSAAAAVAEPASERRLSRKKKLMAAIELARRFHPRASELRIAIANFLTENTDAQFLLPDETYDAELHDIALEIARETNTTMIYEPKTRAQSDALVFRGRMPL